MVKTKYKIKSIDTEQSKEWLLKKHYAKRMCSISYCFGLFDITNTLIGVCTFGSPASRSLCIGVCGVQNSNKVFELNRLCVNDGLERNVLSYFVSSCLKLLPNDLIIVSYADTSQGHNGYIYQATNWIYTGATKERTDINTENGKHSRHYDKRIDKKSNRKLRSSKHRYVYFTGSKKLQSFLNYKIQPYPKGENKRYDSSFNPNVQCVLF